MKHKKNIVYLGLGSNLRILPYKNKVNMIEVVKLRLPKIGLRVIRSSSNWQTYPIPYSNIPQFVNCVVKCKIINKKINNPKNLLYSIKNLEYKTGRKKNKYSISRVIDIDILDFQGKILNDKLILPHPRLHLRKFVLKPMRMVCQNWTHPIYKKNIDFLISKIKTKQYLIEKL